MSKKKNACGKLKQLMNNARTQAKQPGTSVFVMFHSGHCIRGNTHDAGYMTYKCCALFLCVSSQPLTVST